jgi:hypothetical protein
VGRVGTTVRKFLREFAIVLTGVAVSKSIVHLICVSNPFVEVPMEALIHLIVAHLLVRMTTTPLSAQSLRLAAGALLF